MIPRLAPVLPGVQRVVTILLGLSAAAGWGMFAVASHSASETERHLQEQFAGLQVRHERLQSDQDRWQSASAEVVQLRKQLAAAQEESARLAPEKIQGPAKPQATRPLVPSASSVARQPPNEVSHTGSVIAGVPTPPQAPLRSARMALAQPKPGLPVAETGSGDSKPSALDHGPSGPSRALTRSR